MTTDQTDSPQEPTTSTTSAAPSPDPNSLEAFLDSQWRIVESYEDEVMQTCVAQGPGGLAMIVCPWGNDRERTAILDMLRAKLAELKVYRYVFLSEAWMVNSTMAGAMEERARGVMPSESPHRISTLQAIAVDGRTGEVVMRSAIVAEHPKRALKQIETKHGGLPGTGAEATVSGGLTTLLPFEPKTSQQVH